MKYTSQDTGSERNNDIQASEQSESAANIGQVPDQPPMNSIVQIYEHNARLMPRKSQVGRMSPQISEKDLGDIEKNGHEWH